MKKYVLGFIFDTTFENVLLIHKNRPDWQRGLINGLGGKVEEGEDSHTAIVREITEESGLMTQKDGWVPIGALRSDTFLIDVFGYVYEGALTDAQTLEDEIVEWFAVASLPENTVKNLPWLVPITIDKIRNQRFEVFDVLYKE